MLRGAMVAEVLEPEAALRRISPLLEQEPHGCGAADERNLVCAGAGSDGRDQVSEMSVRRHGFCVRRLHQHSVDLMGAKPRQNLVQGFREGRDLGLGQRIVDPTCQTINSGSVSLAMFMMVPTACAVMSPGRVRPCTVTSTPASTFSSSCSSRTG